MVSRNVVFDFGGVLLRWKPQEILDRLYEDEEMRARVKRAVFEHPDWLELDRGTLEEEEAGHRFATRIGCTEEEIHGLFEAVRESLIPMAESIALLRAVHSRGNTLYGLSNMSAANFAYLRQRDDHWNLFRGIVISGEIKLIKPEPAIFEYLCNQYQLRVPQTIFVDDHPPNVESARQVGLESILFKDAGQCRRELELAGAL